ncbi:hypothetical protein ACFOEQ_12330 [Chryseobacterium arachidis]|uniref:hypothetical protein n=1 Tax=Chryseobacterium arachidis TaxID=1416778 RepID=UPI00360A8877
MKNKLIPIKHVQLKFIIPAVLFMNLQLSGQVGIGVENPDPSAILELNVNNLAAGSKKGFLGPRLALASNTDVATIPNPATGLLVFNSGTNVNLNYVGYVFWNGTEWRKLDGTSIAIGTVGTLNCNSVSLTPDTYTSGVPYTGTMSVPYTGGNGGSYPAQSIGPVNGLTATLVPGNFSNGAGTLYYNITGTPTVSSPSVTTFSINIGGNMQCGGRIRQCDFCWSGSILVR